MLATVFMFFLTVSEQKSKVMLISEISEFAYLALWQIQKIGNLRKIFLSFKIVYRVYRCSIGQIRNLYRDCLVLISKY